MEDFIEKKVEEVLSSTPYQNISEEKRAELRVKINKHLEGVVLETFINRLSDEEAEELLNAKEDKLKVLRRLAGSNPDLAKDIEQRVEKEVETFKSLI